MPYNGSGVYSAPSSPGAFNPAVTGQQGDASDWNTLLSDITAALSNVVCLDGQSTITADISLDSHKLTSVGNASALTDATTAGQVQDARATYAVDTGSADAYAIAPAPPCTAYKVGQSFEVKIVNANLTPTPTLTVSSLTAGTITWPDGTALAAGDIPAGAVLAFRVSAVSTGTPTFQMQTVATARTTIAATQLPSDASTKIATDAFVHLFFPRGLIAGLTLSTAGGSGTFGIAAGQAADTTNTVLMALGSAYTKTTGAWTLGTGNGALDTGIIANNTWHHVFEINRPDTNVSDVLISLSPTSPTLPTNYTLFRRIGSMLTDGSAHWLSFIQRGSDFWWGAPVSENGGSALASSTSAALVALTVPTGINSTVRFAVRLTIGGSSESILFTSPLVADTAPGATGPFSVGLNTSGEDVASGAQQILTNTSGQIRQRAVTGSQAYYITTHGWIDPRGKDS